MQLTPVLKGHLYLTRGCCKGERIAHLPGRAAGQWRQPAPSPPGRSSPSAPQEAGLSVSDHLFCLKIYVDFPKQWFCLCLSIVWLESLCYFCLCSAGLQHSVCPWTLEMCSLRHGSAVSKEQTHCPAEQEDGGRGQSALRGGEQWRQTTRPESRGERGSGWAGARACRRDVPTPGRSLPHRPGPAEQKPWLALHASHQKVAWTSCHT